MDLKAFDNGVMIVFLVKLQNFLKDATKLTCFMQGKMASLRIFAFVILNDVEVEGI